MCQLIGRDYKCVTFLGGDLFLDIYVCDWFDAA